MSGSSPFAEGLRPAVVYFGYRGAAWLAEHLPIRAGDAIAHFGADVAHKLAKGRRLIVRRNLARVVGDDPGLDAMVKAAFRSYAEYWLETFRLGRYSAEDIEAMVHFDESTIKNMEEALGEGKGVLLATAHLGFYDFGVAWVGCRGWRFTTVAEVLRPRALFEWFAAKRSKWGWGVVPAERGALARRMSQILTAGEGIALVCDRDLNRRGVWVEFFGEKTTLPASPPLLLVRKKIPLIAGAMYKEGKHFRVVFNRIGYELGGDEQTDLANVTQVMAHALEDLIKRAPEQWHLFSTNWPSDEAHLPPRGRETDGPPVT